MELTSREVTLVLCTGDGSVLGALRAFEAPVPYWQEAGPVVTAARDRLGAEVTLLRVLAAPPGTVPMGGAVTYLAEVAAVPDVALTPWPGDPCAPEPLRQTWAEPGGPAADLRWAEEALRDRGFQPAGYAAQVRSWNLSSLWRLPLSGPGLAAAWLKVVPPFFGHEGAVLSVLDPGAVPPLLAYEGPRALLAEVAGEDGYDSTGPVLLQMVERLVGLQAAWVRRADRLLALGAADFGAGALAAAAHDTYERTAAQLAPDVRRTLETGLAGLDGRFEALEACGIPDTLVHGDFHPGNVLVRAGKADADAATDVVILDWGDCGVGHPLLDQAAFTGRLGADDLAAVRTTWDRLWRTALPGCDPGRAADLVAPVAALRQALIYRMFLDRIEPDERIYHVGDPAHWLTEAARRFASATAAT